MPINNYDAIYFEMFTAEKRILVQNKKGYGVYEWHKAAGARNESFDCRVYARAALRIMSSNDALMLKRIHLREPWAPENAVKDAEKMAEQILKEYPNLGDYPKEKSKHKVSKNQKAKEKGVYL
jgi:phage terminase large subunit GpA-like protein